MRAVLWMGGVVVALAAVVGASRLWAESKEKKPAPRTRIAILNLTYVIKHYDKYREFQEEIKKFIEPYKDRDTALRAQIEELHKRAEELLKRSKELRKQAEEPSLVPTKGEDRDEKSKREELEEKEKKTRKELEENTAKIKKELGKKSDTVMKNVYGDIVEAARRYATANGIDLVLHYNDSDTEHDLQSAVNIARKLNTGALMPVYWDESMDISLDIVAMLNEKSRKK